MNSLRTTLQNRVDPFGNLINTPARGAWLGNRGVLHNEKREIIRPYKIKAWITCLLEFRGRHREIMTPNSWTELFFLDEATAFSAGHRPCFQCRYKDHLRFKEMWLKGNPQYGFNSRTSVVKIDEILHRERITAGKLKVAYQETLNNLPNGTFITYNNQPYLVNNGKLHPWSTTGYGTPISLSPNETVHVLTPRSIVNMLSAGYIPQMGV